MGLYTASTLEGLPRMYAHAAISIPPVVLYGIFARNKRVHMQRLLSGFAAAFLAPNRTVPNQQNVRPIQTVSTLHACLLTSRCCRINVTSPGAGSATTMDCGRRAAVGGFRQAS